MLKYKGEILMFTRWIMIIVILMLCSNTACISAKTDPVPKYAKTEFNAPSTDSRLLVFISDLHLGIGHTENGEWHVTEDFRWQNALKGFLDEISQRGNDAIDLIIVGDFIELWQPPDDLKCNEESNNKNLGCTIVQMQQISELVMRVHAQEMADLKAFSQKGENRIHIVPGNHDSTLLLADVWDVVADALDAKSGRINLVESGVWVSPDGSIVAEHGHQIGNDLNKYEDWPTIARWDEESEEYYVIRPWGEFFMQKIFNDIESIYPLIDNLEPETAGIKYRLADRSLLGNVVDVARFLKFNLFETSLSHKVSWLGEESDNRPKWDVEKARKLGYKLFANAYDPEDPWRRRLLANDSESNALQEAINEMIRNPKNEFYLSEEEVCMHCDLIAIRKERLTSIERAFFDTCEEPILGSMIQSRLYSKTSILKKHIEKLRKTEVRGSKPFTHMKFYIYAHTHQLEESKPIIFKSEFDKVCVFNTGAFQRLVSDSGLINRVNADDTIETPSEGLEKLGLETLSPCYTFVMFPYENGIEPVTLQWYMPENGQGKIVFPGCKECK